MKLWCFLTYISHDELKKKKEKVKKVLVSITVLQTAISSLENTMSLEDISIYRKSKYL